MNKKQKKMLARIAVAILLTVGVLLIPSKGWLRLVLYLIPYFVIGYDILWKAVRGIANRQVFDENFLMAVATVGALVIGITKNGDYLEAIGVMLFYQIGEWFQSYAVGKSRRNISQLMDIRPDVANVYRHGELQTVDPEEVKIGSVIVVRPGEKVPIDGIVLEGRSEVNTSALTGESIPREISPGEEILSGCVNGSGVLKIETRKEFGESTVSKILDLVENASSRKSRAEAFISRFARGYTPAVCYSALALAILPPLVRMALGLSGAWGDWVYRALTFLVISCPCALVISIPLSFFAGIGGASREGVLIKGSNYLEILAGVGCVVFDKTGTLTRGVFEVSRIEAEGVSPEELLELATLAESASSHPISKSLQKAYGRKIDRTRLGEIREVSGHGVSARVDGKEILVGNKRWMERQGVVGLAGEEIGTTVFVAMNGKYCGKIVISDEIKPNAKTALARLKCSGVKKTVMLTGDAHPVALAVAKELGVDTVHSELLPGDKVAKVEELLAEMPKGSRLAFVGDGINDAPVLTRADVGIAMGAMGSDAAIEAADVVLMDDDPQKISTAIRISRKCMATVRQNIVFALGVKGVCLLLGAFGIANMWLAIFADVGVMVLAVLNAIRALFVQKKGRV